MRWRAPSERTQMILALPIAVPAAAILIVCIAPICLIEMARRKLFPPRDWHPWFAWRPVRISDWFDEENYGKWFWLETIEKRRFKGDFVEYRAASGIEAGTGETTGSPEGESPKDAQSEGGK